MPKSKGYFITGTDTSVGKTVVTACLLALNRQRGLDTGFMKPIETGGNQECSSEENSDAKFLLTVSGNKDSCSFLCASCSFTISAKEGMTLAFFSSQIISPVFLSTCNLVSQQGQITSIFPELINHYTFPKKNIFSLINSSIIIANLPTSQ